MSYNFHVGSNSYIAKYIINKNDIKINRNTFLNKNKLIKIKKKLNDIKFDFIFIYIGKNFKEKNISISKFVNFQLPLQILNFINSINHQKKKIFFFGTNLEDYKVISPKNKTYVNHKIKLKKEIFKIYKKKEFEFVWLKLPIVCSENQKKNSFFYSLSKLTKSKEIQIDFKYQTLYFVNASDIKKQILYIKKNWNKFKNREINLKSAGPFYLSEVIDKIKKQNKTIKVIFKNVEKFKKVIIKSEIKTKLKKISYKLNL